MELYNDFFKEIKQFIIKSNLDTFGYIKGVTKYEIEKCLQMEIVDVPEAYISFLEVFGGRHLEIDFNGLDFTLESIENNFSTALETYPRIVNSGENIIITLTEDDSIFFIPKGVVNPKVFGVSSDYTSVGSYQELYCFTTFIRELPFQSIEKQRRQNERLIQIRDKEQFAKGKLISEQVFNLRSDFLQQINTIDTEIGILGIETYLKRWQFFFESSNHYLQNKDYYKKWERPFMSHLI
ncbi:MAG: hypothetical protein JNL95_00465 [Chitinophagales bacterium]|nr:hypothetical protein [Chitinophagales bacterium]